MHIMSTHRKSVLLPMLLFQLAIAPAALARGPGGMGHGLMPPRIMEKLNLSAEQKQRIQQIEQGAKEEMSSKKESHKKAFEDLKTKMAGDKASDDELKNDFSKIQDQHNEMAKKRFERMLQIRAVLTPEQRQKFRAEMEKHRGKEHGKKMSKGVQCECEEN